MLKDKEVLESSFVQLKQRYQKLVEIAKRQREVIKKMGGGAANAAGGAAGQ